MKIKSYEELKKLVDPSIRKTIVVAAAHDENTLESLSTAAKQLPLDFILVGEKERIEKILGEIGNDNLNYQIISSQSDEESAQNAVRFIKEGKGDMIMKGALPTSKILKAVVNKEHGIRKSRIMHHVSVLEADLFDNLIFLTDAGMIPHPTLQDKKEMLGNMIDFMRVFGYTNPKIVALAASETVSEKMPETTDAVELQRLSREGEYGAAIVEGPMAFDVAVDPKSAKKKGIDSKVSGQVEGFIVPDIVSGNLLAKMLVYCSNGKMAGCILGASVPIILSSRSATAEEKLVSIMLCLIYGG